MANGSFPHISKSSSSVAFLYVVSNFGGNPARAVFYHQEEADHLEGCY